jgi:hypothetical protein
VLREAAHLGIPIVPVGKGGQRQPSVLPTGGR